MIKRFLYLAFCFCTLGNGNVFSEEPSQEADIMPKIAAGAMATINLRAIGVPAAYKTLQELLLDSNSNVRDDALLWLASMRCEGSLYCDFSKLIFEFLLKEEVALCGKDNIFIYYRALLHTGRCSLGDVKYLEWEKREILQKIKRGIHSADLKQQFMAVEIIPTLSYEAIQELDQGLIRSLMESKNPQVQKSAISALSAIFWTAYVPAFVRKFNEDVPGYEKEIFASNQEEWLDLKKRLKTYIEKIEASDDR